MTIFNFSVPTYVGDGTNEWLMGPGRFEWGGAYRYVAVGTNAETQLPSGLVAVSVDAVGKVQLDYGPQLTSSAMYGFCIAFTVLSVFLLMRWFVRSFFRVPGNMHVEV